MSEPPPNVEDKSVELTMEDQPVQSTIEDQRVQSTVKGRPTHQCLKCSFQTPEWSKLVRHEKSQHLGTRCMWNGCDHVSSSEQSLRNHIRAVHNSKIQAEFEKKDPNNQTTSTRFKCLWPDCNKTYSDYTSAYRCSYAHQFEAKAQRSQQSAGNMTQSHAGAGNQQNRPARHSSLPATLMDQSRLPDEQNAYDTDQKYSALQRQITDLQNQLGVVHDDLQNHLGVVHDDLQNQLGVVHDGLSQHILDAGADLHDLHDQLKATRAAQRGLQVGQNEIRATQCEILNYVAGNGPTSRALPIEETMPLSREGHGQTNKRARDDDDDVDMSDSLSSKRHKMN
ncbi:hypothetical protein F4819DRAFT_507106 [Hypoxylon fuscum]|nr:hypothetical protein F4819DRAFT_507106 [Hypoxylon fuscum]